jgi:iron complex transport system ATP-binding protein
MLRTEKLQIGHHIHKPLLNQPLSLQIPTGKFVSLLGANGTGKSTLLHTLAGLIPPLSGQIFWGDETLSESTARERAKKLALVLAPRPVAPTLRVYEVIELGRYPHQNWQKLVQSSSNKTFVERALELTELTPLAERKLYTLSDGEHQKVMIARALAQDTPLILLDEPTAHLDLPNRVMIFQMLRQLSKKQDKTILTSTHELNLALQVSDEVWLLNQEGNLDTGTPEDLILQDKFISAFPEKGFDFDKNTGNFHIHHAFEASLQLKGEGLAFYWTKQALEKNGYIIDEKNLDFCIEIKTSHHQDFSWSIRQAQKHTIVFSISELINYLRNV